MVLPNQLIVSGAGTAEANGIYTRGADFPSGDFQLPQWFSDSGNGYIIRSEFEEQGDEWVTQTVIIDNTADLLYVAYGSTFDNLETLQDNLEVIGMIWDTQNGVSPAPTVVEYIVPGEEPEEELINGRTPAEHRRMHLLGYI